MMTDHLISPRNRSNHSLKAGFRQWLYQSENRQQWLKVAERVSLAGSVAGAVASTIFGQIAYATIPLSLHVLLMRELQHHRSESLQNQQLLAIEQLEKELEVLQTQPQKYLTRTHLTPIIAKLQQIQRQQKTVEIDKLANLTRQIEQLQQRWQGLESQPPQEATETPLQKGLDRVVIFIDEANLYHAASERKIAIDYDKLFSFLKGNAKQCRAIVYTAIAPGNKKQQRFLTKLRAKGFKIVSKNIVRRADGSCKGNLDLELGLDMVNLVDSYDTAVLVSGDGDFACAIKQCQGYGKQVKVASFRSNTSPILVKAADSYIDLETASDRIC